MKIVLRSYFLFSKYHLLQVREINADTPEELQEIFKLME